MLPQTMAELEAIRQECRQLLNKRATLSAVAAAIPLPGADISADVAIMTELLITINSKFGLDAQAISQLDPERRKILLVLITSIGNEVIGKAVTASVVRNTLKRTSKKIVLRQASRWMPLVGQALSAGISFAAMRYLGSTHIDQCYQVAKDYLHQVDTRWTGDVIDL